jgi:hypothetical protein
MDRPGSATAGQRDWLLDSDNDILINMRVLPIAPPSTYFICLVAAGSILNGQELTKAERRKRDYPAIYSLVELAERAPSELRALGFQIAGSQSELRDREWREELLEHAFEAGAALHLASPVLAVVPPEGPMSRLDSQRMARQTALNAGVDRLSLQSAAVRSMATVNREKSAALFELLSKPDASDVSCASEFIPDTSSYFSAAAAVGLAGSAAARVTSALDVAPALQAIPAADRENTVTGFSAALTAIPSNSRAWTAQLPRATEILSAWIDASRGANRQVLLRAWRAYLAVGLGGPQCAEVTDGRHVYTRWVRAAVNAFNSRAEAGDVAALSPEEQKPEKIEPGLAATADAPNPALEEVRKGLRDPDVR